MLKFHLTHVTSSIHLHIRDSELRISDLRIMAHISFRLFLVLLLGIQTCLYAEGHGGIIVKHALVGQQVNLTCYLNSTEDVTWRYSTDDTMFPISTCKDNQNGQCPLVANAVLLPFNFQATRSNETSTLSLTPYDEKRHDFMCELGNNISRKYSVKSIHPSKITPNCTLTYPRSSENGVGSMTLSCEVNSGELDVSLTLEGIGLNVFDDAPWSSQSIITKTLYFDDFNNVRNASCKAYFPDINITLSCTYPNIVETQYIVEGNDIIIECNSESDVVYWRLYGSDGEEEDIEDRSLIRDGGRSLLIRYISELDYGKLVVCRTKRDDNQTNKGTIGFHVISKITEYNNYYSNYEDQAPVHSVYNGYLFLTLLFLTMWLTIIAVCGVMYECRSRSTREVSTIPRTSDDEQTQTTPEYATVILSISGRKDLDTEEITITHLLPPMSLCILDYYSL